MTATGEGDSEEPKPRDDGEAATDSDAAAKTVMADIGDTGTETAGASEERTPIGLDEERATATARGTDEGARATATARGTDKGTRATATGTGDEGKAMVRARAGEATERATARGTTAAVRAVTRARPAASAVNAAGANAMKADGSPIQ